MKSNNPLLDAMEKVNAKELLSIEAGKFPTGLVKIEDILPILEELEVAVRSQCECDELERVIEDKSY